MQLNNYSITVNDLKELKLKMLNWVKQFNIFCLLDNNAYSIPPHNFEWLLAADPLAYVDSHTSDLQQLDDFIEGKKWLFGHLSYDLKNRFFPLTSREAQIGFPDFYFFQPRIIISINDLEVTIQAPDPSQVWREINEQPFTEMEATTNDPVDIRPGISKEEYIDKVNRLKDHIRKGDCYEVNFCQEFYAEQAVIDPYLVFHRLNTVAPAPFAGLYRLGERFLISASPERFLLKKEDKLIAQPMKGTARRSSDQEEDKNIRQQLQSDPKERAENIMIVDLMRNDLSKIAKTASVKVEELCGLYSFPSVHQLISTISCDLRTTRFSDILEATFPMGSMTGAPKKKVLELIDENETSSRGIFSGCIGYFHEGDFDLNVVIRSIMYQASTGYLSYRVGSGITFYSEAEKEWEECLLKGEGIKKVLTGST